MSKQQLRHDIAQLFNRSSNAHSASRSETITEAMQLIDQYAYEYAKVTGDTSDGYHTFNELYEYRMLYNALLFNEWAKQGLYNVHKSNKHSDGQFCFGGGWFVVSADTPAGQITNHYEDKHWNKFKISHRPTAVEWDGHTPEQAAKRLAALTELSPHRATKDGETV